MRIPCLIILLFFLYESSANDSLLHRVFNLTYNMEYEEADSLLKTTSKQIDKFYFAVLTVDLSYWRNVTGTNHPDYKAFEKTLGNFKIEHPATLDEKIISLITLSYGLRYELKRFKIFDAISTRKKMMQLYEELFAKNLALKPEQKELFEVYSALIIYFNSYLKPSFSQSKKMRMNEAVKTMQNGTVSKSKLIQTLSSYFLGKTLLKYEKEPEKAVQYFEALHLLYPNNFKFAELLLSSKRGTAN